VEASLDHSGQPAAGRSATIAAAALLLIARPSDGQRGAAAPLGISATVFSPLLECWCSAPGPRGSAEGRRECRAGPPLPDLGKNGCSGAAVISFRRTRSDNARIPGRGLRTAQLLPAGELHPEGAIAARAAVADRTAGGGAPYRRRGPRDDSSSLAGARSSWKVLQPTAAREKNTIEAGPWMAAPLAVSVDRSIAVLAIDQTFHGACWSWRVSPSPALHAIGSG